MLKLTKRQQQVLQIVKEFMRDKGMPPTRAEIAKKLGFKSANAAEEHLKALAKKGVLEIMPGTSRGLRITQTASEQAANETVITSENTDEGLPVLGQVAAGSPLLAEENIDFHLKVDPSAFRRKADYLLRVKGLSMNGIGIMEGDLLAVHRTAEPPRNGQLVVARIDNEVTVKRFKKEGNIVWLLPENTDFEPIKVDLCEESLEIEGFAVGLIRDNFSDKLH
ncbi:MAG: transcriptional repressor LexA [Marinospirillum sp.]|uniref:transcriptional repressor LexA n=1 Tax=Marinospirillum sp. TaxID=2183934 RepID=UPI0019F17473|nr:transcriptional repressor LexA [Marinospirillum sp.]MBE0506113.1 transcriptional repressor LexA [Marinospirillum sp.]